MSDRSTESTTDPQPHYRPTEQPNYRLHGQVFERPTESVDRPTDQRIKILTHQTKERSVDQTTDPIARPNDRFSRSHDRMSDRKIPKAKVGDQKTKQKRWAEGSTAGNAHEKHRAKQAEQAITSLPQRGHKERKTKYETKSACLTPPPSPPPLPTPSHFHFPPLTPSEDDKATLYSPSTYPPTQSSTHPDQNMPTHKAETVCLCL